MRWACLFAILVSLTFAHPARSQDQPAPPPESLALKFARRDAARVIERVQKLSEAATQAAQRLEAANKALADAKQNQQNAVKALADADTALKAAEQAKPVAEKALADAQTALTKVETEMKDNADAIAAAKGVVETAQKNLDTAAKQLTEAAEKRKTAETAKNETDKQVPVAEQGIKPATEAKAAADKELKPVQDQLAQLQARVAAFEKAPPKADPTGLKLVQTFTHNRPIMSCRFDANGDFLFAGAQDNSLHRWDLFTGSPVHVPGHKSWIGALALAPPSGQLLLTGGMEGKLLWWNPLDPSAPQRTVEAHKGHLRTIAVSPDGQLIATGGNDLVVRVWSAVDGSLVKELPGHTRHIYNVAFHPTGKALVSGDLMGIIKQWDTATWTETRELDAKILSKYDNTFKADCGGIRGFDFSPDGKFLAAAGITDVSNAFAGIGVPAVALFDWESGKQVKLLKPKENFQGTCWAVKFHPSGEFLVAGGGGGGGELWFWKTDDDKSFAHFKLPNVAYDLAWHPDTLRLAVGLYDNTVRVYDLAPKYDVAAAPTK